ncbi:hypothetical protein [Oceanithermus desulfurans]|uniref:Uncharacterized protein n=2 Tax=Oceanithermus desulfurans TaxID=227924 RepID=A0A511RFZ3_9DEIN|nr:hypothetical protein [Oceanithermus desulfurans]MBB6030903.1 hypothetical protein [Oceanithermus desulfurans]GEM88575.1 hypothetical protein ODE01S_00090 [Oceanithermus desulfurans NBRC 100063]
MNRIAKYAVFGYLFTAALQSLATALWFTPRQDPLWARPPSTLPCVYNLNIEKTDLPSEGPVALLVVDYGGYVLGEGFTRKVYDDYFGKLHKRFVEVLPVYVLLSAQEPVVWGGEVGIEPPDSIRIPCGLVDDPENARKHAYMPGLYLYREGALKFVYFNFPFIEVGRPEIAQRLLDDVERFTKGYPLSVVPLPLLSAERIHPPPGDLPLPVFLMQLTGMEWAAPPGEQPLKRPRIVHDEQGSVVDFQEFPSGHPGARGRYLIEKISPFLAKAGVTLVGLIPPDGLVSEAAVDTLKKMRLAFPDWVFIQLNEPAQVIRFREAAIRPCLILKSGTVHCFGFFATQPQRGNYFPIELFPTMLEEGE